MKCLAKFKIEVQGKPAVVICKRDKGHEGSHDTYDHPGNDCDYHDEPCRCAEIKALRDAGDQLAEALGCASQHIDTAWEKAWVIADAKAALEAWEKVSK